MGALYDAVLPRYQAVRFLAYPFFASYGTGSKENNRKDNNDGAGTGSSIRGSQGRA
jgi:hypothetical protein